MRKCLFGASALALFFLPVVASAQWSATIMHPVGYASSSIHFAEGDTRYGSASPTNEINAGIFTGLNTFTSLHPASAVRSIAGSASGGYQFGSADTDGTRAARWNGTTASYEDWTPQGASQSTFYCSWGSTAGGWAQFNGISHALLWNSGPEDYVDLNPVGALGGAVQSIDDSGAYGDVTFAGGTHAAKWLGTAGSFTDLNPFGATDSSVVSTGGGRQSGYADYGQGWHATQWDLPSDTVIDLHPLGADWSVGMQNVGALQTGWANFGGVDKAAFWNGTAGSYQDLHGALSGYVRSQAYAMQIWNGEIQIFGAAWTGNGDEHHAVMWTQPVPEPGTMACLALGILGAVARRKRRTS